MQSKFAKALAESITTIAGNVARVALIDEGIIQGCDDRAECCERIDKAKANIAAILQQPGAQMID